MVSASAVSPLPTVIAAVVTFPACVLGLGKGGGFVVNPANVHWAIVNPQIGLGPAGAVLTVSVSVAWFPVSRVPIKRFVEVLLYVPITGTVTLTEIVHVPAAATDPPVKRMPRSLAASAPPALSANVPPQVLVVVRGEATTIAPGVVGNVSVKLRPVSDTEVGLVMVNVSVEIPLTVVGSGLKFFAIVTSDGSRI